MHRSFGKVVVQRVMSALALLSLLLMNVGSGVAQASAPRGVPIRPLAAGGSFYYYVEGRRVALTPSLHWMSVRFASNNGLSQLAALATSGAPVDILGKREEIPSPALTLVPLARGVTQDSLLAGVNAMRARPDRFLRADPVFETPDAEMALTDEFIATFEAGKTAQQIADFNAARRVELVQEIEGQPNTFVLRVLPEAGLDALTMANQYQESGAAKYAAPNWVRLLSAQPQHASVQQLEPAAPTATYPNDYWYTSQWHLDRIHASDAWNITQGSSSIVIAVIDEGVEFTHEDLSGKGVKGYDATDGATGGFDGAPCTAPCGNQDDAHGTNVAGLAAAATNNTLGVAGVCPNCMVMPVRIAYGDGANHWITYDSWIANGITWAYQNGAAILSNSWGGGSSSTVINTAISNAKSYGRGGKGSVVLFAAGNDNHSTVMYPASLSTVIAVGASNMCDLRKAPKYDACNDYEGYWGSNYGSALDVSAPGVGLYSTDRMGTAGYWGNNYYPYMNGTSGATPIASGVVGLMLSVNPYLTATQVQSLLQSSADDIGAKGKDAQTGYGRVNAYKAVVSAITLKPQSTAAYDGWILECFQGGGVGCTKTASGSVVYVGDNSARKQYRAILSFDTTGLPPTAVIDSVTLKLKKAGGTAQLPFAWPGNSLVGDIMKGSFNGNVALESADFDAPSSVDQALVFSSTPDGAGWYAGTLSSSALSYINPSGPTQFRVYFTIATDGDSASDYLKFYSGNAATATRPVLEVQFHVP